MDSKIYHGFTPKLGIIKSIICPWLIASDELKFDYTTATLKAEENSKKFMLEWMLNELKLSDEQIDARKKANKNTWEVVLDDRNDQTEDQSSDKKEINNYPYISLIKDFNEDKLHEYLVNECIRGE